MVKLSYDKGRRMFSAGLDVFTRTTISGCLIPACMKSESIDFISARLWSGSNTRTLIIYSLLQTPLDPDIQFCLLYPIVPVFMGPCLMPEAETSLSY